MSQFYTNPSRESDPYALPDAEVFYVGTIDLLSEDCFSEMAADLLMENGLQESPDPDNRVHHSMVSELAGWYYWSCFPGCLPDGDPIGPFESEDDAIEDAIEDARSWNDEEVS